MLGIQQVLKGSTEEGVSIVSDVLADKQLSIVHFSFVMNRINKMRVLRNNANRLISTFSVYPSFLLLSVLILSISLLLSSFAIPYTNALAQSQSQLQKQSQQPNIKASNIYQTQTIVLGKNIKNLVILIPNEGHEDPTVPKDLRVINQPYVPQNAIVNIGTTVTWLNGDAGHRHSITLVDNNSKSIVYDSGRFDNFNASKPFMLNNPGTFTYSGPSYDRAVPNYKMNGSITVVDQPLANSFNNTNTLASSGGVSNNSIDTIATLMVPSKLLSKTISELKNQGFTIDNQHSFTSIRGSGSAAGGDKQQVLLVLTSSGKNLNQVSSTLAQVASKLPYK
jgi:plastocyanin